MSAQPLERREGARGLKAAGAAAASSSARGAARLEPQKRGGSSTAGTLPVVSRAEPSGQDSRRCGGKGNLATSVTGW